jgi:hypothetical protein
MAIEIEVYTTEHVIRGQLETSGERLSDILNAKNESALVLNAVKVTRHLNIPKAPPMEFAQARVEKKGLLFALPVESDLTRKSMYRRAVRQGFEVSVFVPNFELRGTIHLIERWDVRRALLARTEEYIALTDASATFVLYPQLVLHAETIVFSKSQLIFIGEPTSAI